MLLSIRSRLRTLKSHMFKLSGTPKTFITVHNLNPKVTIILLRKQIM